MLKAAVAEQANDRDRRNAAREYLQHYALLTLYRARRHTQVAFTGGTALRMLYGLPRFSEDLDYVLLADVEGFDFAGVAEDVRAGFAAAAYEVQVKLRSGSAVASAMVKFPGLPFELGLSSHRDQVLSIRLEVDTRPPAGAVTQSRPMRYRHMLYEVVHCDLSTIFAGKLHALCFRPYTKGRDLHDLLWFLTAHPGLEPNLEFLNNTARQTEEEPPVFTSESWRLVVAGRLDEYDFEAARADVAPFLAEPRDAELLKADSFRVLLVGGDA